jgi:hypothetical protein
MTGHITMAVRHEIENLIRRGNIFYWRPRIPAHFQACPRGCRLQAAARLLSGAALNAALLTAASDGPAAVLPKAVEAFRAMADGLLSRSQLSGFPRSGAAEPSGSESAVRASM